MSSKKRLLTREQGQTLVQLARETLQKQFGIDPPTDSPATAGAQDDPIFQTPSGVFVTLKMHGDLRGCIGSLTGCDPLWQGVQTHAVNAGFCDPRFPALTREELDEVHIEVSVLTEPQSLAYENAEDLVAQLRPHEDGVILRKGAAGATYLPQVWEQLPDAAAFLSSLCVKAGLAADTWRREPLKVETYQVQYFEEE